MRSLRSLIRSQSLTHSRRPRTKEIFKIIVFSVLATNATNAQERQKWGEAAIDGIAQGFLMPFTHGAEGAKSVEKSFEKQLFKPEGSGKIETKDGGIRIDTKDEESMRLAAEFRKQYKKPPECFEPKSEAITIKCANDYIKARKNALNQQIK